MQQLDGVVTSLLHYVDLLYKSILSTAQMETLVGFQLEGCHTLQLIQGAKNFLRGFCCRHAHYTTTSGTSSGLWRLWQQGSLNLIIINYLRHPIRRKPECLQWHKDTLIPSHTHTHTHTHSHTHTLQRGDGKMCWNQTSLMCMRSSNLLQCPDSSKWVLFSHLIQPHPPPPPPPPPPTHTYPALLVHACAGNGDSFHRHIVDRPLLLRHLLLTEHLSIRVWNAVNNKPAKNHC